MGVESSARVQVSKVLVVYPNEEWLQSPLQPVLPLLESQNYCQQLTISHVVVSLHKGEKGTWRTLVFRGIAHGENGPYSGVRGIHLHQKLRSWVRMLKNGGVGEQYVKPLQGCFGTVSPFHFWIILYTFPVIRNGSKLQSVNFFSTDIYTSRIATGQLTT